MRAADSVNPELSAFVDVPVIDYVLVLVLILVVGCVHGLECLCVRNLLHRGFIINLLHRGWTLCLQLRLGGITLVGELYLSYVNKTFALRGSLYSFCH